MRKLLATALFALCYTVNAQENTIEQDKVITSIKDYFNDDRENIYLHLNKEYYLAGEDIWYKGYVTEKKTNRPFTLTSNVFVVLSDQKGKILNSSLNYTSSSLLRGYLNLSDTLSTGKYYIHAYTNYMNNFEEDESSKFPIYVVNTRQGKYIDDSVINYDAVKITLFPEGGNLINDVANTVGIHVFDCNGKGIATNGDVVDDTGNGLVSFTTNSQGYGRLSITPKGGASYKAECTIKDRKFSSPLPYGISRGITFSINNYTFDGKMVFAFKTNAATLNEINNDLYSLVVFQGQNVILANVKFTNNPQLTVTVPLSNLTYGINTVLLLDKNQQEVARRVVYKPDEPLKKIILDAGTRKNGIITFNGQGDAPAENMSISILPQKSSYNASDISSKILIDNYLNAALTNPNYYFADFSKQKHFELDNFLLCQESKYKWKSIQNGPPQKRFDFDYGLSIKGKINTSLPKTENTAYLLVNGITLNTEIDEKSEFLFDKLVVTDSTDISFFVNDKSGKSIPAKMYLKLGHNKGNFVKSFVEAEANCLSSFLKPVEQPFPKLRKDVIELAEVDVKGKDKKALNKENSTRFGNANASGHKISQDQAIHYGDVLNYLRYNGYSVSNAGGQIRITSNSGRNGTKSPAIFVNDFQVTDFGMLQTYKLEQVDEIYINNFSFAPGASGGTIRIYLKKGAVFGRQKGSDLQMLTILDGYQAYKNYEYPDYTNVHDEGFLKYGSVSWISDINSDAEGKFKFSFPETQQKTVRVLIEGIDPEGRLFSETRLLEIK